MFFFLGLSWVNTEVCINEKRKKQTIYFIIAYVLLVENVILKQGRYIHVQLNSKFTDYNGLR
jgi:hypothetical protein